MLSPRIGLLLALAVGGALFACADPPRPRQTATKPSTVARHMMLIVTEDDGAGSPTSKKDSIVLAEPLERVPEKQAAFGFTNASYRVGLGWDSARGARCLGVTVEREGAFRASGCVPTDEPSATVAMVERPSGGSVEVVAWFFDADAPLPSTRSGSL